MPEVSVCIPAYNGERFLREAIDSVFAQEYQDFEIVVSDDASTDQSNEIVHSYHDPRLRLYRNEIGIGIPGNWNLALGKARGRYIKFLFQDDVIYPDCLSTMVNAMKANGTVGIVFGRRDVDEQDGLCAEHFYLYLKNLHEPLERNHRLQAFNEGKGLLESCIKLGGLYFNYIAEPSFVMLDSTLIPRVGYFDNRLRQNADYEYWLRFLMVSDAYFVDRPLGRFRLHAQSESSRGNDLFTKLRYLYEERLVISNLIALAEKENAQDITPLLDARRRWFLAYRLRSFLSLRLGRLGIGCG